MSFEQDLLKRVDRAAKKLGMTRSGFARNALREALDRLGDEELKHRRGYEAKPVRQNEFDLWEAEQLWPD